MNDSSVLTDIPSVLSRKRIVIGIGEFAISAEPESVIVTHALGSCVAVCLWDPTARVGVVRVGGTQDRGRARASGRGVFAPRRERAARQGAGKVGGEALDRVERGSLAL